MAEPLRAALKGRLHTRLEFPAGLSPEWALADTLGFLYPGFLTDTSAERKCIIMLIFDT